MADGLEQEASEVQKALIQVRTQHGDLCAEQEKIRHMKLDYMVLYQYQMVHLKAIKD